MEKEDILKITNKIIGKLCKRSKSIGVNITFSQDAISLIAERGYSKKFGARELRRTIIQMAETPLAQKMLDGEIKSGDNIIATSNGDEIIFSQLHQAN